MEGNIAKRLGLAQRPSTIPTRELAYHDRNVGVEIEVEDVCRSDLREELGHLWEITRDGSLRPPEASAELRSPTPGYAGKQLIESIDALASSDTLATASFGWRCATHIHVDMRDKTASDLHKTMVVYSLLEPFIFAWEGNGRHESRFAMPWWVCSQDMSGAADIIEADKDNLLANRLGQFSKYTALNLEPLRRFGTIEYRHAQATRDRHRLIEFINICLDVSNASLRHPEIKPIGIVVEFMDMGPDRFMRRWLGNVAASALMNPPRGLTPLTEDIFDRSVNTAVTLAELYRHRELVSPSTLNTALLQHLT